MKKNVKALILSLLATLAVGSLTACDTVENIGDKVGGFFGGIFGGESSVETSSPDEMTSEESGTSEQPGTSEEITSEEEEEITIMLSEVESMMRFADKQLTATIKGTQEKPTWTSSNPEVATVDENGLVSALTLGETVITVSVGNASASCTVTVIETDIPHEIEVSLDEISVFEGNYSEYITVDVSFDDEILEGDFQYTWSFVDGDEDAVRIAASTNGKSVQFEGLKVGTATYEIYTVARGYEVAKEITITVKENTYSLGISHKNIVAVADGYAVNLTLGDETTDNITFGDAYLAVNGAESEEKVAVAWKWDEEYVAFENGTVTAIKAGTAILTGTATYKDKELAINLTVSINKGQIVIDDTATVETVVTKTFEVPKSVEKGEVEKIYFGNNVVFDKDAKKGSIEGATVTFDVAGMPAKDEDLGVGKVLTIETNLIVYTMTVDVYTMIIDSVEELNMWQEVAAENAIKAGLCVEEQKGITYNGYFLLNADIEYNGDWRPYKKYGELWALCYQNKAIWKNEADYKAGAAASDGQLIDGAFQEDWGKGAYGGFKGTFDGQGHYINGMNIINLGDDGYNAFIVTLGNGTVKNVAFTNMTIGESCNSVVDRGNGTLENIYVEINSIASGKKKDGETYGLIRGGNAPTHVVNNAIIDYSDADLSNLTHVFLGCDIKSEVLTGVYVIGVPESFTGGIWNHEGVDRHQIGVYETYAKLFADSAAQSIVSAWEGMWTVGEGYALPTSVMAFNTGKFVITNTEKAIPADSTLTLTTDKFFQYVTFSLKEEVAGISVKDNVITVSAEATVGSSFTVVATSAVDGTAVEITFTVDKLLEKITAENVVDVDLGLYLDGASVMVSEEAVVDLSEIYDTYLLGKSVIVKYGNTVIYEGDIKDSKWSMPLNMFTAASHGADKLTFIYLTEEKNGEITLPINLVQNTIELNSSNVADPTALCAILTSNPYGNYVLTSNLNMKGAGLKGIKDFYGSIDGNGYMITNTYIHHDALPTVDGSNVYNPTFIMYNHGTVKNIGFKLDKLTQTTGGRPRGIIYTNHGTIENVYVDVTFVEEQVRVDADGVNKDLAYYTTGALATINEGTVKNVLANVRLGSGAAILENTTAGVVYENKATIENVYTINNGTTTVMTVMKGVEEDAFIPYETWAQLTADDIAALGALWKKEGETIYFGNNIIYDATVRETIEDLILTNSKQVATLTNAAFTLGSKWTVVVNGVEESVVAEEEGKLAVVIDPENLVEGYKATVIVKGEAQELSYNNIVFATYINSVEELVALAVGGKADTGYHRNSDVPGNDKIGYFVLGQDLDFATYTANNGIVAAGYSYQKSFFKGVFDGNGHTIKNIKVGAGGIFGGMKDATVKNVNFKDVTYFDNNSVDGFHGNYTALFAQYASGCTISDITITVKATHLRTNNLQYIEGLFVCQVQENTIYKNIDVDASYLALQTVLGSRVIKSTVYENVSIKAGSYVAIGYSDSESAYETNPSIKLTEWPVGVTYTEVSNNIPNPISSMSGKIVYYDGDVTALGFAAGSHVYQVNSTNSWSDRVIIPVDKSYDYVEFDIVLTAEVSYVQAWPAMGTATKGDFRIYASGCVINYENSQIRTVQVFKANGDMFKAQANGEKLAANTMYTIRVGFNESEKLDSINVGLGQTFYISNSRFGNYDERVYVCGTGALIPYYEGDVTALGFAADTKVTAATISSDAWGQRVRVNTDVNYDYVDITFAVDKTLPSVCIWAYGLNGVILPGNYSATATSIVPNKDSDPAKVAEARRISITDLEGNAVTAMEANKVYKLRIYLNDNTSSVALSTFDAKADNAFTFYFGGITYGNDVI